MHVTIILGVLSAVITVFSLWALIAVSRLLLRDCSRYVRHFRFGLLELMLVVGVIAAWCAMIRAGWDSWTIGPMLLFIPPSILAIGMVRFAIEDARLRRECRQNQLAESPPATFEAPAVSVGDDASLPAKRIPLWRRLRAASKRFRGPSVRTKLGGN